MLCYCLGAPFRHLSKDTFSWEQHRDEIRGVCPGDRPKMVVLVRHALVAPPKNRRVLPFSFRQIGKKPCVMSKTGRGGVAKGLRLRVKSESGDGHRIRDGPRVLLSMAIFRRDVPLRSPRHADLELHFTSTQLRLPAKKKERKQQDFRHSLYDTDCKKRHHFSRR